MSKTPQAHITNKASFVLDRPGFESSLFQTHSRPSKSTSMEAGDASLAKFLLGMGDDALARLLAEVRLPLLHLSPLISHFSLAVAAQVYRLDAPRLERVLSAAKKLAAGPSLADYEADVGLPSVHFEPKEAEEGAAASNESDAPRNGGKDPVNALWSFEGHTLRELKPASANPHNPSQLQSSTEPPTGGTEADEDGHPVLFGSCGRGKRYARCSVCYFRGLRCNTGYYCACCQRPVCVRPRTYPGEEHPKICWNVLHVDKDMVQRVEKKKKRKLQQALGCAAADSSGSLLPPPIAEAATVAMERALHGDHTQEEAAAAAHGSPFAAGLLDHHPDDNGDDPHRQESEKMVAAAPSVEL